MSIGTRGGKVDYKNLWRNHQALGKHIRWRTLRLILPEPPDGLDLSSWARFPDGTLIVHIFGYACPAGWFGYTHEMLNDAPCCHCGQTGIFQKPRWQHVCPGHFNGKRLPCQEDHACKGEPSMATAPMWKLTHWKEVPLGSCGD